MAMRKSRLRDAIREGAVLIKDGTLLPEVLQIKGESCVPGWRLVRGLNGHAFDRKARAAGWTFFCLAGEIGTIALGTEESLERKSTAGRTKAWGHMGAEEPDPEGTNGHVSVTTALGP
jgi:hypothetical protein